MSSTSEELRAVEASNGWCPSRTVWVLGTDGLWHCTCCGEKRYLSDLVNPVEVRG